MKEITYYHLPVWLSILVHSFIKEGLASKLKNSGTNDKGLYRFITGYGEDTGREERLIAWNATTSARAVCVSLKTDLPYDVPMLVSMAEEYARERNGREETKVCRGIIQLLIARAVELYGKEHPDETLTINGDFGLIGQLPPNGRLHINGKVGRVEGSTGTLLEVSSNHCPRFERPSFVRKVEGVWTICKTKPNCVFPPG